jgi:hypothetical protein
VEHLSVLDEARAGVDPRLGLAATRRVVTKRFLDPS